MVLIKAVMCHLKYNIDTFFVAVCKASIVCWMLQLCKLGSNVSFFFTFIILCFYVRVSLHSSTVVLGGS